MRIHIYHHFPNDCGNNTEEELKKINLKLDDMKVQLDRIESKLDQTSDQVLLGEIMDKLNALNEDIKSTVQ